ncbi:alpha/beta fold hydrolase [Mycobacterium sp. 236(2023)]|uniref:alpha/beta fold hydrolase n=1 Tax=Mycobacterium sp. 236(2023) TaxID=3038163 RepID=UPI00241508AB|nr:alpha/beta fold hydrolase [Mycobacterium sp. 236(2023)]MDG4667741.1 hypothetical protein [Mycobacterium sp. 236(2023)]
MGKLGLSASGTAAVAKSDSSATASSPSIKFIPNERHRKAITQAGAEIRMHGVGDHATYSALGRPSYESRCTSQVVICEPPPMPSHHLLLIAWSRANRELTRTFWWYLLFPFTLVNVAGYMTPRRKPTALLLRVSISVVSIILTATLAAWVTVIVETVWLAIAGPADLIVFRLLLSLCGPVAVGAVIVYRICGNNLVEQCGGICLAAHLAVLAAVAAVCCARPAQWVYDTEATGSGVRSSATANTVDPMAYVVGVSTTIVTLLAVTLAVAAVYIRVTSRSVWEARDGSALAAAALLLMVATGVLHTGGSLVRLVAEEMMGVIEDIRDRVTGVEGPIPHTLLPHPEGITSALRIDLLLGFFAVLLLILGVNLIAATAVNVLLNKRRPRTPAGAGLKSMSRWHSILRHAPGCLSFVVVGTTTMTAAAWTAMALHLDDMSVFGISLSRNVVLVVGVIAIGFLIIRRPERAGEWIKRIFEMIADIAGFWPRQSVPLAGASYRDILIEGIEKALKEAGDQQVALVGHSQGSVICSWYMSKLEGPQSCITLYTCGSPLSSLYAAFFPTYFGQEFFETVAARSAGNLWFNYWRVTDPIATALPSAENRNVTERETDDLLGHSEYWPDEKLRADIDRVLHQPEPAPV